MAVQYFSHVGLCVADLDRSVRFYCEALGFRLVSGTQVGPEIARLMELEEAGLDLHARFLERDGVRIELLWFASPEAEGDGERRPLNVRGLTHFAVRVDDVASTAKRIRELGGRVLEETSVGQPDAGIELIYAVDPDGVRIELMALPGDPSATPGEPVAPSTT